MAGTIELFAIDASTASGYFVETSASAMTVGLAGIGDAKRRRRDRRRQLALRGLDRLLDVRDVLGVGRLRRERGRDVDLSGLNRRVDVIEVRRAGELVFDRLRDLGDSSVVDAPANIRRSP